MFKNMHRVVATSIAVGAVLLCGTSYAAQDSSLPDSPIRLVTPYPAGGSHSLHAGIITAVGADFLGQPLISVIKGGGGGVVAATEVAHGPADGSVLLFGDPTINVLRPMVEKLPYKIEDFVPVARINYSAAILVTTPSQPFKTVKEFVSFAKDNPGKVVYSSDNKNGFTYTVFELLKKVAGLDMRGVQLGGGGPAVTQLLGGNTMAYAGDISVVGEHIKAGTLTALCVADSVRLEALKDVPTCREEGYDVVFRFWRGIMAPASTPEGVVAELSDRFGKMAADSGFQRLIKQIGSNVGFLDHREFSKELEEEEAQVRAAYSDK